MNFVTGQADLARSLKQVAPAVAGGRSSHPILTHVLLDATHESLTVTAFDLSLSISTTINATVETPGQACVPARVLADLIVRLNSDDAVAIATDGGHSICITTASGTYTLAGDDPLDYPALPAIEPGNIELDGNELRDAIDATIVAASKEEAKQILQGIYLQADDNGIELAATNGHRLNIYGAIQGEPTIGQAIPAAAIREVLKLDADAVEVSFDAGHVAFGGSGTTIRSRVFEGKYPNYRQLVPAEFATEITLDRKILIQALERVAIIAEQYNSVIKLNFDDTGDGVVTVSSEHETGFGSEQLLPKAANGPAITIAANVRYLIDAARSINTPDIQMAANTSVAPFVMRPGGEGCPEQLALIMPVQVRQ